MIALLLHKANVSYDLRRWGPKRFTPALKKKIRGRLQDRVMSGCDFAVLHYEKVIADWQAEYPQDLLEEVLCTIAERHFGRAAR